MSDTLKNRIVQTLVNSLNIKKKDIDEAIDFQKAKNISLEKALLEKLIEEMMARGMMIDVDHMSEKATDAALALLRSGLLLRLPVWTASLAVGAICTLVYRSTDAGWLAQWWGISGAARVCVGRC